MLAMGGLLDEWDATTTHQYASAFSGSIFSAFAFTACTRTCAHSMRMLVLHIGRWLSPAVDCSSVASRQRHRRVKDSCELSSEAMQPYFESCRAHAHFLLCGLKISMPPVHVL